MAFMDNPWAVRGLFCVAVLLSIWAVLLPTYWSFTRPLNWMTIGYVISTWQSFERTNRQEREEHQRRMHPWYGMMIRIRWILAVTRNVPGQVQLSCIQQELNRTHFASRVVVGIVEELL